MPTEAETAWAAGLFEGEGTWGYQPNNVRAALAMTDRETVERFHEIVGVGRIVLKKRASESHKQQFQWLVTDHAGVRHVLLLLEPWLGDRRWRRGHEVLQLQIEAASASKDLRDKFCPRGHLRTTENTKLQSRKDGSSYRRCRACGRKNVRDYRSRKRDQLAETMREVVEE